MSKAGVPQLLYLRLNFSQHGGSSRGMREFIEKELPVWKEKFPHVRVETLNRPVRHPWVEARHVGMRTFKGKKVAKQICVKNEEASEILERVEFLRSSCAGKSKPHTTKPLTPRSSVQGVWTPSFAKRVQLEHNLFAQPPPKWYDKHLEQEIVNVIETEDPEKVTEIFCGRLEYDTIDDLPPSAQPIIDKAAQNLLRKRQDLIRKRFPSRVPIYPPTSSQ